jgi:hypothetical protein
VATPSRLLWTGKLNALPGWRPPLVGNDRTANPGTAPHGGRRLSLQTLKRRSGQVKSAYSRFRFRPLRSTVMLRKYNTGRPA